MSNPPEKLPTDEKIAKKKAAPDSGNELKGTGIIDPEIKVIASEAVISSYGMDSQAPGNMVPITDAVRDIQLATQKLPQIITPEQSEEGDNKEEEENEEEDANTEAKSKESTDDPDVE